MGSGVYFPAVITNGAYSTSYGYGEPKGIVVLVLGTVFIAFLHPKNVHFDPKLVLIAITEMKIWGWCFMAAILKYKTYNSDSKDDFTCVFALKQFRGPKVVPYIRLEVRTLLF